jgi:hypothetical protein
MEMQLRCITTSQDIGRECGFGYIPAESKHGNLNSSSAGGCDLTLSNFAKTFSFGLLIAIYFSVLCTPYALCLL